MNGYQESCMCGCGGRQGREEPGRRPWEMAGGCPGQTAGEMPAPMPVPAAGERTVTMPAPAGMGMGAGMSPRAGLRYSSAMTQPAQPRVSGGVAAGQMTPAMSEGMDRNRFPIAMGYVPIQQWQQPYSLEEGFRRGTIFPELDLAFTMGRCR